MEIKEAKPGVSETSKTMCVTLTLAETCRLSSLVEGDIISLIDKRKTKSVDRFQI